MPRYTINGVALFEFKDDMIPVFQNSGAMGMQWQRAEGNTFIHTLHTGMVC